MINRLRYVGDVNVPQGNGDNIGFGVLRAGDTIVADFGASKGQKYVQLTPTTPTLAVDADTTLTAAQANGLTVVFDDTTAVIVTLPAASDCKGCRIKFVWKQITAAGTGHGVAPVAVDGIGGGVTALTSTVDKAVYSDDATDAVTDRLEIVSTGAAGEGAWVITDYVGTFTKEA